LERTSGAVEYLAKKRLAVGNQNQATRGARSRTGETPKVVDEDELDRCIHGGDDLGKERNDDGESQN
jgi:hypothetical protein